MAKPGAARKGVDVAGGLIIQGRQSVIVNGQPIACRGDAVQAHAPGGVHGGPVLVGHEPSVLAEGVPVSRLGDPASCGHPVSTASDDVIVGT